MNGKTPNPVSSFRRRARRCRVIGVAVLLLGLAAAGFVCWLGTRSPDLSDDLAMVGYNRAESRQMGMLYGKEGVMIEDFQNDLKQPGTQAALIATLSVIIASGCFYFARLLDHDGQAGS